MLIKTHLALAIFVILLFLPHVSAQFLFIGAVLVATFLPDIDTAFSKLGQFRIFRFLQFFVRHRGFLHSLTFAVLVSVVLSMFWPAAALGFFLGYALHILADGFTKEGVEPFWPFKWKSSGFIATGGYTETILFIFLVIFDLLLLIFLYFV